MQEYLSRAFKVLGAYMFVSASIYVLFDFKLWVEVENGDILRAVAISGYHFVWSAHFIFYVFNMKARDFD